jgi:catechol 2,3-dioxygenase-like lactoylglutathione lyase family enzyme
MQPKYIDHIVLVCKDVETTYNFYKHFLGEPEHKDKEQVAWKIGETKLFFGLPYKEYVLGDKDSYSLNHVAFGVKTIEELKQFEEILDKTGIANKGIRSKKYGEEEVHYLSFDDPDGYRIEFYLRYN